MSAKTNIKVDVDTTAIHTAVDKTKLLTKLPEKALRLIKSLSKQNN